MLRMDVIINSTPYHSAQLRDNKVVIYQLLKQDKFLIQLKLFIQFTRHVGVSQTSAYISTLNALGLQ